MKAFLEQKEVLFYSHTVNILRKKLPKRGHMPVYLGRTQKITTLIYILLCGFQMVWYTLSHLMNIILLIFHTTFEATEAQRIPYPITSNRGVRSPDPIITAFFYSVRAHTTQRKPSELVHKISPLGISLLKVKKKKKPIFGCTGSSALCRFFLAAVSRGYPSLRWVYVLLWRLLLLQRTGSFSCPGRWTQEGQFSGSRAQAQQFSTRAQLLHSTWDLPWSGIEPVPPALAGELVTPEPPGKPRLWHLQSHFWCCISLFHDTQFLPTLFCQITWFMRFNALEPSLLGQRQNPGHEMFCNSSLVILKVLWQIGIILAWIDL